MEIILIAIITGLIPASILLYFLNKMKKERDQKVKDYSTLLSQKKSSEIILGQVSEKLVPFLAIFKHDPQKASFLGNPIDYVVFNDDEVVFVEVKSGRSKLTSKQRKIKKIIQNKKVRWEEIRIKPN